MTSWIMKYKADAIAQYRSQKQMADAALARTSDNAFFTRLRADGDDHTNSIAILVKHLAGNFRSRWTDFLTTDGEKADRQREREFIDESNDSRATMMLRWEESWAILFATVESLTEADFERTVTIRGESLSVLEAIQRNLLHASHHIGQIDMLATALE